MASSLATIATRSASSLGTSKVRRKLATVSNIGLWRAETPAELAERSAGSWSASCRLGHFSFTATCSVFAAFCTTPEWWWPWLEWLRMSLLRLTSCVGSGTLAGGATQLVSELARSRKPRKGMAERMAVVAAVRGSGSVRRSFAPRDASLSAASATRCAMWYTRRVESGHSVMYSSATLIAWYVTGVPLLIMSISDWMPRGT
mmetsp:Transcript_40756/g.101243  ORF Transcript_40756/g.101243 Transcript_40756/m.101243 type:complete len:202 (+) Transcript_40756:2040-2645(+)